MIRKATSSDIESILSITRACAKNMVENGIYQWNEHYPNATVFEEDIDRDELYVITNDQAIAGTVVISTVMDDIYKSIQWLTPNDKNLYIHRLAVHPYYQGRGLAQKLMDFAENNGAAQGYESIRLDTFSKNERNQKFYEVRGYKRLGKIYFPIKSEHPFYCYELLLHR